MNGYELWLERFKRVVSAYRHSKIPENDLSKFQLFLLDTGQFNANFSLEELEYLNYPKSPFVMMHKKSYLREAETWAMQILRFRYQEANETNVSIFPIFLDSNLFWNELQRYYQVIRTDSINDNFLNSLINKLDTEKLPGIWIEVTKNEPTTNQEALSSKALHSKFTELIARKKNVPDILFPLFKDFKEDEVNSELIEELNIFFTEIRETFYTEQNRKIKELPQKVQKFTKDELYGRCTQYDILPTNISSPWSLAQYSQNNPDRYKKLLENLVSKMTLDIHKESIEKWIKDNVTPIADKLSFYFRDNFKGIETLVLYGVDEESDFTHKAIEKLSYRIDPVRVQKLILQLPEFLRLFVDDESTQRFWDEFNQTSLITTLPSEEQEKIEHLQQATLNLLSDRALPDLPPHQLNVGAELQKLKNIIDEDALPANFQLYAKFLYEYLASYHSLYSAEHALRYVSDGEIIVAINMFLDDCRVGNFSSATRVVQNISEIMLLDLSHTPLSVSNQLPTIIRTELEDLPVQGTLVVPYGMRAFVRVFQLLEEQYENVSREKPLNIYVTSQSYYEWLESLEGLKRNNLSLFEIQQTTDIKPDSDIIFLELHPNNVLASKQFALKVKEHLDKMLEWSNITQTLVIDMTLNAMQDQEIQEFLYSEAAQKLIADGRLNIILIQSLTKFAQLGLDKRSCGILTMINSSEHWHEANKKLVELRDIETVDTTTLSFFSSFACMEWPEVEYITLINNNVRRLYEEMVTQTNKLEMQGYSGLQIAPSSDPKPCYIAINTNGFISDFNITTANFEMLLSDILNYFFYPLCKFYNLPISERYSIGFPLTSINPVLGSLRLTVGLEPEIQIKQYAEILVYIGFVFTRLPNDQKLKLIKEEEYRKDFIEDKVAIFKAITPGEDISHEWIYESQTEAVGAAKRKVKLQGGNIKFFAEIPSNSPPHSIEWTELSPQIRIRDNQNAINANDLQFTMAERRIIANCYTSQYKSLINNFENTVSVQTYEIGGAWNINTLYGPFKYKGSILFIALYQKKMDFYYKQHNEEEFTRFIEANVVSKQGTIDICLNDMSVEDREFLVREVCYFREDISIPATDKYSFPEGVFDQQYIPRNETSIDFFINPDTRQLVLEESRVEASAQGVTIYSRELGAQMICYEIDYWAEKDQGYAKFLRLITAIYVKHHSQSLETGFKPSNSQFTHFIFNLTYEDGNRLFKQAIKIITYCCKDIKEILEKYISIPHTNREPYLFPHSSSLNWPSGYNAPDNDSGLDKELITNILGKIDEYVSL